MLPASPPLPQEEYPEIFLAFPSVLPLPVPCKDSDLWLQASVALFWSKLSSERDIFHTEKLKSAQSEQWEEKLGDHNFL
jgi:hypothetical protein